MTRAVDHGRDVPPAGAREIQRRLRDRVDLETAVEVVLSVSPRYRVPEPIRRADRLVGRLRREAGRGN